MSEREEQIDRDSIIYQEGYIDGYKDGYKDAEISSMLKLKKITEILDSTDFNSAISLNGIGEDKGYKEAICAISLAVDGKCRWI